MLVRHAYENVEYYHTQFNLLGLKPNNISTVTDLQKLPILTKEEIRKNFPERITAKNVNLDECTPYSTSGSTGIPLKVLVDPVGNDFRAGLFGRPFFECGLGYRDKMMLVGDARHFPQKQYSFQKLGFLRRKYFSAAEPIETHIPDILEYNPDAIFAYSSYLFLLAKAIQKSGTEGISPKMIFSTAEILSTQERAFIERILGGTVFDLYGSTELERLAWECGEHVGYHMDCDGAVIEFLKGNEPVSPGEEGKIVVTCLYNYAMPLIRYEIGDIGVPSNERCTCGRGLPLAKKILGRKDDYIVCPNGRVIFSPIIIAFMRSIPGIAQFKFVQESKSKLNIYFVKDETFSRETLKRVTEEVRQVVGEGIRISPVEVEQIEKERSGKLRSVISHVKQPED